MNNETLVIAIFVLILIIIQWLLQPLFNKKTIEQSQIQNFEDYRYYINNPGILPLKFPVRYGSYIAGFIGMLFVIIFVDIVFIFEDNDLLLWVIFCVFQLFFLFLLIGIYKRIKKRKNTCVVLDSYSIMYENKQIFYSDITRICHDFIKHKIGNRVSYEHFFIIKGLYGGEIRLRTNELREEYFSEIFNCCLYHNPNIMIDEAVMDILINKKIPRLYTGDRGY